jgi:S-adenosylmethionine decarboxylase
VSAPTRAAPAVFTPHSAGVIEGCEWIVEATGCNEAALRDPLLLGALFAEIVQDVDLHPVAPTTWHRFPHPGGVTGVCVLAESHLTIHTFPEHGSLCLNLFCCRLRDEWPFAVRLRAHVGATSVRVRRLARPYGAGTESDAGQR